MKIDAVTFHNYKCFAGTTRIDGLSSNLTFEKRVVLFGGLNGAGKTTLLEALLLCFYGKRNTNLIPSQGAKLESYAGYINSILNKKAKSKVRAEMWVEVELSDVEISGIPQSLRIRRNWTISDHKSAPIEELTIDGKTPDGKPSSFVGEFASEDDKDTFIEEFIPYEVSQFFFFDGEKIQDFVRDEDEKFAKSLAQVLGISSYNQLHNDLKQLRGMLVADHNKDSEVGVEIKKVETAITECERDIENAKESVLTSSDEIIEFQKRIEVIEMETRRLTRINAENWEQLLSQRDSMVAEKATLDQQIFDAIKDNLPLVINAKLCEQIIDQLTKEDEAHRQLATQKSIEPKVKEITNKVFYDGLEAIPALNKAQKDFYVYKLQATLKNVLGQGSSSAKDFVFIHDLTREDAAQIKSRVNESKETVSKLAGHIKRLQQIEPVLDKIKKDENQMTKDPVAEPLFAEKGQLTQQIKEKNAEIENLKALIDRKEGELQSLQSQRTRLEGKAETTAKIKKQIEYCGKLCEVVKDFSDEFRKQRAEQLAEHTVEMWKKLARKQDLIDRISIDPERHFSIGLYDKEDRPIDKTKLSAGEKELLAIALIWALARIANRSLPVVIDTPLGRLDNEHRAHIAQHYFPNTSHQVILLSTDTEIVGTELAAIKPYISKSFSIQYDEKNQTSTVTPDSYFEKI